MECENNNENIINLYIKRRNSLYNKQYHFIDRKKYLTKEEIRERISDPSSISIWDLRSHISQLKAAGFSVLRYEVRFHSELSHPLFLVAMMLVGCALTMKKFIGNKKSLAVIASIMLGFGLYYVRNLAQLLAEGGQLNIIAATWIPSISSILIALGLILHMEDG